MHRKLEPDNVQIVQYSNGSAERATLISLFEQIAFEEGWQAGTALQDQIDSSVYLTALCDDEIVGGIQLVNSSGVSEWWPSREVWPGSTLP